MSDKSENATNETKEETAEVKAEETKEVNVEDTKQEKSTENEAIPSAPATESAQPSKEEKRKSDFKQLEEPDVIETVMAGSEEHTETKVKFSKTKLVDGETQEEVDEPSKTQKSVSEPKTEEEGVEEETVFDSGGQGIEGQDLIMEIGGDDNMEVEEEAAPEKEPEFFYVEEEEKDDVDRDFYYTKYEELSKIQSVEKMKNNFLHKKMADYYRKRKLDHVLKESDMPIVFQHKYDNKLDAYSELLEIDKKERERISEDLRLTLEERDKKLRETKALFNKMQKIELDATKGITFAKTGNVIPDKLVERLLRRQKNQMELLITVRLNFIKLKNKYNKKQKILEAIDNIGPGLHLMDYEQLKEDNRTYMDKLEERENELTTLRVKCSSTMQMLAHIREKSATTIVDIETLKRLLDEVESDCNECREELNEIKKERDEYRIQTNKLIENSGLLTQPLLLKDMENSMSQVDILRKDLENLKVDYNLKTEQVKIIRFNIEVLKDKKNNEFATKAKADILKGRPSILNKLRLKK